VQSFRHESSISSINTNKVNENWNMGSWDKKKVVFV
jgi:hypothetical protein